MDDLMAEVREALEAEWYNGNLDESAYDRILARLETAAIPPTAELERLRRIEAAAIAAMRAGWFTTNDAGDRAADALRAALDPSDA